MAARMPDLSVEILKHSASSSHFHIHRWQDAAQFLRFLEFLFLRIAEYSDEPLAPRPLKL